MKHLIVLIVATVVAVVGCGLGVAAVAGRQPPPGNTIVKVTGNAANGFTIHHYDGTTISPPTDSEARAECGEYDARLDRVRCRVEVRTWYRDLGILKRALSWAHAQ